MTLKSNLKKSQNERALMRDLKERLNLECVDFSHEIFARDKRGEGIYSILVFTPKPLQSLEFAVSF